MKLIEDAQVDRDGIPVENTISLVAGSAEECNKWKALLLQMIRECGALIKHMRRGAHMTHCGPKLVMNRTFFLSKDSNYISWKPVRSKFDCVAC